MDQDAVLRARMLLLSTDRRVLRGPRGLWASRVLTQVSPEVCGSKSKRVPVDATRFPEVSGLPRARLALLEEAVATARARDRQPVPRPGARPRAGGPRGGAPGRRVAPPPGPHGHPSDACHRPGGPVVRSVGPVVMNEVMA